MSNPLEAPQDEPRKKSNSTPDLTDEEYMEQLVLLAQAIAVMPSQRDGMPNVTTPPPIRARWAKFMISLGIRIVPELATHKLKRTAPVAAGNFGPQQAVAIPHGRRPGEDRTSMKRTDMAEIWQRMNPETFEGIKNGTITREDLLNQLPPEMQEAARMAEQMAREQQEERDRLRQRPPPKVEPDDAPE